MYSRSVGCRLWIACVNLCISLRWEGQCCWYAWLLDWFGSTTCTIYLWWNEAGVERIYSLLRGFGYIQAYIGWKGLVGESLVVAYSGLSLSQVLVISEGYCTCLVGHDATNPGLYGVKLLHDIASRGMTPHVQHSFRVAVYEGFQASGACILVWWL